MAKELAKACRCVIPVKRIEIRRSEVLKMGDGDPESIIDVVATADEEAAEEDAAVSEEASDDAPEKEPEETPE
jgi:small subunit ribosomal protein S3Ae